MDDCFRDYNEKRVAWIDLETTGLDENQGNILEVACIITDEKLNELAVFERTIAFREEHYPRIQIDDSVREMHTVNGLWERCKSDEALPLPEAMDSLASFIEDQGAQGAPIAGNTIGFDKRWLKSHAPEVLLQLHYRSIDVSSFKCAWRLAGNEYPPKPEKAHRALDDIRNSIREFRVYFELFTAHAARCATAAE